MKIKWFGYSSFLVTSAAGVKIITDPYQADGMAVKNAPIEEDADVVTMTHGHFAVSYVFSIRGVPRLYTGPEPAVINGIPFRGVEALHGLGDCKNTLICFEVDGVTVCHLGDLGYTLTDRQIEAVGRVDILLMPADGTEFTLSFEKVTEVIRQLQPKVVIPMRLHDKEAFFAGRENIDSANASEVGYMPETLPHETRIVVLEPAL